MDRMGEGEAQEPKKSEVHVGENMLRNKNILRICSEKQENL